MKKIITLINNSFFADNNNRLSTSTLERRLLLGSR